MFAYFSTKQVYTIVDQIKWKYILISTICIMALTFTLYKETPDDPPPVRPKKSNPESPPLSKSVDTQKPPGEIVPPFLVSQLADGNFEMPYDNIPIAEPIAVCMSAKDQAEDMIEFFVHHYNHMGIRRFYVMDDGSDPPLSSFEYPGIPRTALTFTYQERETRDKAMQMTFYWMCIERFRERHTWIAFLDVDEFLDTPGNETLAEVLKSFEDDDTVGALGVNWRMHTSSGLISRPESTRKSFTTCIFDDLEHNGVDSANCHIKSIVKMSKAGPPINAHKFQTSPGSYTVGEYGDVVETVGWRRPITRTRIGLHHYVVKSREEYDAKKLRGNGMTDPKREDYWIDIEIGNPHVECSEMVAYDP